MNYPGGKGKVFQRIINLMPAHGTYIEAFVGGGAVLRHKRPAARSIAIDLDARAINRLEDVKLRYTEFVIGDALQYLRQFPFDGSELVYCDPPYLPQTRRRSRVYKHDFSDEQHVELLELVCSLPCRVLISGYESEIYSRMLHNWNKRTFPAKTHVDVRTECVWFNYEMPTELHDGTFLGNSFRERQTIKRRQERLREKILRMHDVERTELMRWLSATFSTEGDQHDATSIF